MAPAYKLYKYLTCIDFIFMLIGTVGAVVAGLGMPGFALLFQTLLNKFNPTSSPDELYESIKTIAL